MVNPPRGVWLINRARESAALTIRYVFPDKLLDAKLTTIFGLVVDCSQGLGRRPPQFDLEPGRYVPSGRASLRVQDLGHSFGRALAARL
jgi:hypothetical protein